MARQEPRPPGQDLIDFSEGDRGTDSGRRPRSEAPPKPPRTLSGDELSVADFSAPAPLGPAEEPRNTPITASGGPPTKMATTLTGEVVEIPDFAAPAAGPAVEQRDEPTEPEVHQAPGTQAPVMRITFCKTCGIQNEESAVACRKCRQPLEVINEPLPDIQALKRSWGFDVLGLAWIALGVAAAYCGQFIIKADPEHPGITWGDYLWTGVVVCAPGALIFVRHWFCRLMFWAMTFASALIWAVIGFIWLYVGLQITDNGRVGLMWFAALSGLSLISYITVRLNDEFDAGA